MKSCILRNSLKFRYPVQSILVPISYTFICQGTGTLIGSTFTLRLYQETVKGPFRSSLSQAASCYYQLNSFTRKATQSKVEAKTIPLSALPRTQQVNLPAYLHTKHFKC